ncbi:protein disulfide-isomerase A2 [Erpetoichthys calabaricus]|nr:protein disulfide-isomerase A2 [Erpetoichthys calabaricus]
MFGMFCTKGSQALEKILMALGARRGPRYAKMESITNLLAMSENPLTFLLKVWPDCAASMALSTVSPLVFFKISVPKAKLRPAPFPVNKVGCFRPVGIAHACPLHAHCHPPLFINLVYHSFGHADANMKTFRVLPLIAFLLTASFPISIRADDSQAGEEETLKKTEGDESGTSEEIKDENGILVLDELNFDRALQENKMLLVEFYAPWCGHCQALAPEYEIAAELLKKESSDIQLAKVDVTKEKGLAAEFEIDSFPKLKFFIGGDRKNFVEFTGKRKAAGIVQWLKRRSGPSATVLNNISSTQEFVDANEIAVVGFFKDIKGDETKIFYEVAVEMVDVEFGITDCKDVFEQYAVDQDSVVLFKKFDEKRDDFKLMTDNKTDKEELMKFIKFNSLELVTEFNEQNSDKIFEAKVKHHSLLFINKTLETHLTLLESFRSAASEFREKVLFVLIDINGNHDHVLDYFGLKKEDIPAIRIIDTDSLKKYSLSEKEISSENILKLCLGVLEGTAQPHLMSQEIPDDWNDNPVKILVGKNIEKVAFDETKNVFVMFYAPWCAHCKELTPTWENLAEKYKDHENIIIAKIDATANDIEVVSVPGYPAIKYFPAGKERKIIDYNSQRDVETFSKFLDNGGILPEEEEEEEEPESLDEEDVENITVTPRGGNETSRDEL